jgi:hypothetical protein
VDFHVDAAEEVLEALGGGAGGRELRLPLLTVRGQGDGGGEAVAALTLTVTASQQVRSRVRRTGRRAGQHTKCSGGLREDGRGDVRSQLSQAEAVELLARHDQHNTRTAATASSTRVVRLMLHGSRASSSSSPGALVSLRGLNALRLQVRTCTGATLLPLDLARGDSWCDS